MKVRFLFEHLVTFIYYWLMGKQKLVFNVLKICKLIIKVWFFCVIYSRSIHGTNATIPDGNRHSGYPGGTRNSPPVGRHHRNLPVPDSRISGNFRQWGVLACTSRYDIGYSIAVYICVFYLTLFNLYIILSLPNILYKI